MRSAAFGPPNICVGCSREGSRSLRLQESVTEHSIMGAHIRLVSSENEDRAGLDGEAIAVDEAPVGLPEEAGVDKGRPTESRRGEMLGEGAPPLVAEPEDRASGPGGRERPKGALARLIAFARPWTAKAAAAIMEAGSAEAEPESERTLGKRGEEDTRADTIVAEPEDRAAGPGGRERPKGALARLIAFARPRKAKAATGIMEAGTEAEPESETALGNRGDEDAGADTIVVPAAGATAVVNGAEFGAGSAGPATAAAKPRRPLFAPKGAIAVVVMTGVAAAAIVVLNWPHGSPPQAVEPGMLADQPTKVMAPSAALATVPPREEPNVAGERPQVHETRRDEVQEVLSFRGLEAAASPPAASPPPTPSPVGGLVTVAKPAVPTPDPSAAAGPTLTISAPVSPPASVSPVAGSKPEKVASLPPPASAPAVVMSVAAAPAPAAQEPGLGEVAKIESRLGELEAAIKERSNATVTRADLDKAETLTSDQVARLAAIVTRLTGQLKDLQDQVRTESAGAQEKLADLTRRASLSESKSAVAAAERANVSAAEGSAETASAGVEGQAQGVRMKVAGADQKRNYRIQAASPGLAMLSAIDGGPDDRPVEIAIGTDLPGYGKVRSIEQHGQAWVVKADRGSIE
jgi:hypothetical protein